MAQISRPFLSYSTLLILTSKTGFLKVGSFTPPGQIWKANPRTSSRSRAVAMKGISTFPNIMTIARVMKDGWPLSLVTVNGKTVFLLPLFCTVTGRLTQSGVSTVRFANSLLQTNQKPRSVIIIINLYLHTKSYHFTWSS